MQIQSIQQSNNSNLNFGMAVKFAPSEVRVRSYILNDCFQKERLVFQSILRKLIKSPKIITLSLENDKMFKNLVKLCAIGENGKYISEETIYNTKFSVLKRALKG